MNWLTTLGRSAFVVALTAGWACGSETPAREHAATDAVRPPTAAWEEISPPISYEFADFGNMNYGALTIALSPNHPETVYLGTCYQGIWRTDDTGATWEKVNTGRNGANLETGRNWTVAVDTMDPETLYTAAGFGVEQGLWKSANGGRDWRQLLPEQLMNETTPDVYSVTINPADPDHLLVGSHSGWAGGEASGVLESLDGGRTWEAHRPEPTWGTGHYVFFVDTETWLLTTQSDGFWLTDNSGRSWRKVSDALMQHGANQMYRTRGGNLLIGAYRTMMLSTDDGRSWTPVGPTMQDGYNAIVGDGEFLYAQPANTGLNTIDPDPPYYISAETDGVNWVPYNGGEQVFANGPMAMAFDPVNRVIYSSNWGAGVWRLQL
jgi:hypothetical protein